MRRKKEGLVEGTEKEAARGLERASELESERGGARGGARAGFPGPRRTASKPGWQEAEARRGGQWHTALRRGRCRNPDR